jgi:hypothetical protein
MNTYSLFLFLFLVKNENAFSFNCNSTHGPPGDLGCLKENSFQHQLVRCVTRDDAKLIIRSNDEYFARHCSEYVILNNTVVKRRFCQLNCMTEYYNDETQNVYDDCLCNPNNSFDNFKITIRTIIPNSCYNPDGNCNWYIECLQKRYECFDPDEYAITYGMKYCKTFEDNIQKFSPKAQIWLNNVKKCLQVELVSSIKEYSTSNCSEVKRLAFISHTLCYLKPNGKSGICSLSISDWLNVFLTMKSALIPFSGSALNSLKGVFEVGINCIFEIIFDII